MGSSTEEHMAHLSDPTQRDKQYTDPEGKRNIAAYLVDLHHARKVFKFCGSHQFQLVLSDALLEHFSLAAEQGAGSAGQPVVFDADQMCHIPNYTEFKGSAAADNVRVFHGREVRDSAGANGGQGKVLQLCMAGGEDAEGWTPAEVADYNGWQHDSGRTWRKAAEYELDGSQAIRASLVKVPLDCITGSFCIGTAAVSCGCQLRTDARASHGKDSRQLQYQSYSYIPHYIQ